MSEKKTYYPSKTFDDKLVRFTSLMKSKGWTFSGVDLAQLEKDAVEQRAEREAHDTLQAQYAKAHTTFGQNQEARHERLTAAMDAARGAYKNDKPTMDELGTYKREATKRTPTKKKGS